MEPTFDIPDSTDWLDTPLTLLTPFESSLRCQVCKDFFDNPVITSCSHTFCSLCIRRCLSTEGKCPTCRSSDQELKLRRNWVVQELVEGFKNARPSVLELARKATAVTGVGADQDDEVAERPATKKRKVEQGNGVDGAVEGVRTRSQSRGITRQAQAAPIEIMDDIQDEEYIPGDGLVACPGCSRRMKEEDVFSHLDKCKGLEESKPAAPAAPTAFGSLSYASQRPFPVTTKPPERLPVINYSLLKDTVLRKKLKDLGIPNWGPRPLLQRRHTEWMNLWNANCDSKTPKPKRELLRELEIWERTQGGNSVTPTDPTSSVMRKDFDKPAWSANYDNEFRQLIANARKKSDAVVRSTIPDAHQSAPSEPQSAQPVEQSTGSSLSRQTPNVQSAALPQQDHPAFVTEAQAVPILPQPAGGENIPIRLPPEVLVDGLPDHELRNCYGEQEPYLPLPDEHDSAL
ncbi:E3 ubiquitin-protein ligase RAD18 [Aspergillus undulatus]|uniref:E3 ubiquitin-protein ligase RAD18 n=1 Tax=Aspergillus undulatus TaxID=1810928 RepID=UPI003CCDE3A8